MTREERHRLLGPDVVAAIAARVARAPKPEPGALDPIRDLVTSHFQRNPAEPAPQAQAA